jgi:hypothetical protein
MRIANRATLEMNLRRLIGHHVAVDVQGCADRRIPHEFLLYCSLSSHGSRLWSRFWSEKIDETTSSYWLPSKVVFIVVSPFSRFETDRPTAVFRTIDPFTPVRPACSEPIAMIR